MVWQLVCEQSCHHPTSDVPSPSRRSQQPRSASQWGRSLHRLSRRLPPASVCSRLRLQSYADHNPSLVNTYALLRKIQNISPHSQITLYFYIWKALATSLRTKIQSKTFHSFDVKQCHHQNRRQQVAPHSQRTSEIRTTTGSKKSFCNTYINFVTHEPKQNWTLPKLRTTRNNYSLQLPLSRATTVNCPPRPQPIALNSSKFFSRPFHAI